MIMLPDELVKKMMKLGFKEYEAKVLTALAILGTATATRIHEFSGVPRPRVYDVLKILKERGYVEIQPGTPQLFQISSFESLLARIRKELNLTIAEINEEVSQLKKEFNEQVPVFALTIYGLKSVIQKTREMILNAEEVVYISVLDYPFLRELTPVLKAKNPNKAKVYLVTVKKDFKLFNKLSKYVELCYFDFSNNTPLEEILLRIVNNPPKTHTILAVVNMDGKEAMFVFRTMQRSKILGVWIALHGFAEIQRYLFETSIKKLNE